MSRALPYAALGVLAFGFGAGIGGLAVSAHADDTPPLLCQRYSGLAPEAGAHAGMVRIPAGRFTMGSDEHYAEEALAREVRIDAFWIDRYDVTNAQFAGFVAATGYVTLAERTPDLARHPDLPFFGVCTTWPATSGNGPRPGTATGTTGEPKTTPPARMNSRVSTRVSQAFRRK